jgi:hypothetical protein
MIKLIAIILKIMCTVIFVFIAILKLLICFILWESSLLENNNTMVFIWGESWRE